MKKSKVEKGYKPSNTDMEYPDFILFTKWVTLEEAKKMFPTNPEFLEDK